MKPLVSVIMPVYNAAPYVSEAVESVLNQTFNNLELILIDDCSKDESSQIIKSYAKKDKRVRIYRNKRNSGVAISKNTGFKLADKHALYYASADADDVSLPDRLEKQVKFLEENPDYGMVGGQISLIDEISSVIGNRKKFPTTDSEIRKAITLYCPFCHPTVLVRSEVIKKVGGYNSKYERSEDYEMWFRIIKYYRVANLDDIVLKYRIHKNQVSMLHSKELLSNGMKVISGHLLEKDCFNPQAIPRFFLLTLLFLIPLRLIIPFAKKLLIQSENKTV